MDWYQYLGWPAPGMFFRDAALVFPVLGRLGERRVYDWVWDGLLWDEIVWQVLWRCWFAGHRYLGVKCFDRHDLIAPRVDDFDGDAIVFAWLEGPGGGEGLEGGFGY